MPLSHLRTFLAAAAFLCLPSHWAVAQQDKTVAVTEDDPAMNAAIAKARATLPEFWNKFQSPSQREQNFAVKIEIEDAGLSEHFWCVDIKLEADRRTCAIGNEPEFVKTVTYGQRVDIDPDTISDWMFYRDDRIIGGQTIRALIPKLSSAEAEYYQNLLGAEQ